MKIIKKNKGFTLIELMIIMAIISILTSVGLLSMMDYLKRVRDSAARTDARNAVVSITDRFLNLDTAITLGDDNANVLPDGSLLYVISPGVKVTGYVTKNTVWDPGIVDLTFQHPNGTPGRSFKIFIDEGNNLFEMLF